MTNIKKNDREMEVFLDRLFLNRIYPDDPKPGIKKNLSGLSYRLAWLLSKELNFSTPQKLPKIKLMAEKLKTTTVSIHDSLAQLEMAGIIIRSTETSNIIYAEDSDQFESNKQFLKYTKGEIQSRSFKDFFTLNLFCNMRHEEKIIYNIDVMLNIFLHPPHVYQILKSNKHYVDYIYEQLIEKNFITESWKGSKEKTYEFIKDYIEYYIIKMRKSFSY